MCGISGIINNHELRISLDYIAQKMASAISYRGPDDNGVFYSKKFGIAISHRRLSILDLSTSGKQPMISNSGRFIISFNGEIYNHYNLKKELNSFNENIIWKSTSDTEVLLNMIENFGVLKTLDKCRGMFAFALIDRQKESLFLVRDRFGEKPLYWGLSGSGDYKSFVFASDLNAITALPFFDNRINKRSLTNFLDASYIPAPLSIYENIFKLSAGSFLEIPLPFNINNELPKPKNWWSLDSVILNSFDKSVMDEDNAIRTFENIFKGILLEQKNADVPLGVFLSGGVDSTFITTLLQKISSHPINTFTVGFNESSFNEINEAKELSNFLGTNHNSVILNNQEFVNMIEDIPNIYSEPFADSSQLPTYLVSREARKTGLKVAFSGDGGDELFGGYNRYIWGPKAYDFLKFTPNYLVKLISKIVSKISSKNIDNLGDILSIKHLDQKLNKILKLKERFKNKKEFYLSIIYQWDDIKQILNINENQFLKYKINLNQEKYSFAEKLDFPSQMMIYDLLNYLTDDILVKVDRASMYNSLETRAPFLDNRVAKFAMNIPISMKIRNGRGKWILREILYKNLPKNFVDRPKSGFAIPLSDWLRGPLSNWSKDLINLPSDSEEFFKENLIGSKLLEEHQKGKFDNASKLWPILMWKLWASNNKVRF